MVAGQVRLKGFEGPLVEIRRCMAVLTCDGCELGMVAAVCLTPPAPDSAAILLGRLPPTADYRLIPIDLIDHVHRDAVHLCITAASAEKLARFETK